MEYTTTNDPNIIKQTERIETEIYLDKLEIEIRDLEIGLESLPNPIVCPEDLSNKIKELVEKHNLTISDKTKLENKIEEKRDFLIMLKDL